MEWQLSNLLLSKKLKELEVEQESEFYWAKLYISSKAKGNYSLWTREKVQKTHKLNCEYSAFTVAELGRLLPCATKVGDIRFYNIGEQKHITMGKIDILDFTEADGRAKMLIYLIENKLIKAEDL